MIKLALPGMLMMEAEYFAFEVLTFMAGQLGDASLAAQSIMVTICQTAYQVPLATSITGSTRIANLIGARSSGGAWIAGKIVC
jgi:multidrug resistance protein, MATE family